MIEYYDFGVNLSTVWITVNRACNFRCKWCYAESSKYRIEDDMSLDLAKRITDVSIEAGANHIILIGGEPTMWKHIFDFSDYCREKSISCGMVTNACLFGDDSYWGRYLKSPFDSVGVSVKGVSEEQFKSVVGNSALYGQTIKGLERILNLYPNLGVSVVYSNLLSDDDLLGIARVSREMGAKAFQLGGCSATIDGDCASGKFMVDKDDFVSTVLKIFPVLDDLYEGNVVLEPRLPLCVFPKDFLEMTIRKGQLQNMCHVQNRSGLVFDTDGFILPCNSMVGVKIGRIDKDFIDGPGLMTLLNQEEIRDGYREMLRYPSSECSDCGYNDYCRGGCIVNWMVLDPDICHKF